MPNPWDNAKIDWPAAIQRAMEEPARAIETRDETIREAHASGLSTRELADLTGKSHSWVHNIVKAKPAERRTGK